ncbi:hypothetical protein BB561_004794 [Smittium simulii]|uniref:Glycylpeptide N-tetradecanoyltransferase n=1 Tax=Smittium simulii TaxID=133385 RepID=A0A2T9YE92_9FUNG|nr:hypothetical protein BB561_004794 [Smittium simulii]
MSQKIPGDESASFKDQEKQAKLNPRENLSLKESLKETRVQNAAIAKLIDKMGANALIEEPESPTKPKEHDFWKTQPVLLSSNSNQDKYDRALKPDISLEKVSKEFIPISSEFYWCTVDIHKSSQMQELYTLLSHNYVEDSDELFRFHYSPEFLKWALDPPGQNPDWHIGLRSTDGSNKLMAFISGSEIEMKVNSVTKKMAEINFLCVNKNLRKQRLAPILIQEVTRRVNLCNIFQAVYTAGVEIPTPISVCQYYHRPLNSKKLVDTGFSHLPPGVSLAKLVMHYRLLPESNSQMPGLRLMTEKDIPQVRKILNKYLNARTKMHQIFKSDEIIKHWLLPKKDVIYTYVVEDINKTGKITDFFSFYLLPSLILKNDKSSGLNTKKVNPNNLINSAYLFYYGFNLEPASGVEIKDSNISYRDLNESMIKERLVLLMKNCLMIAKKENFDVFNCVKIQDNELFFDDLKFGSGDGHLHYYFYNWVIRDLKNRDIGLTML